MLTFQKLPLISQDKNHLVQGSFFFFFSPSLMVGLQGRGGIAHLESLVGNLWKWLKKWDLSPSIAPFIYPPTQERT